MKRARPATVSAAAAMATLSQSNPVGAQPTPDVTVSTTVISVEHVVMRTKKAYREVKAALESRLDRSDNGVRALIEKNKVDSELRATLEKFTCNSALAVHYIARHGDWLVLNGDRRNGSVYYIGNVLSEVQMTRQDFGASLYALLRVAVYEDEGGTTIEYDKPTTLFAQFDDPKIDKVAHSLDNRLMILLAAVAQ
jgi:hypothetical protein